jgi:hypothetical protein
MKPITNQVVGISPPVTIILIATGRLNGFTVCPEAYWIFPHSRNPPAELVLQLETESVLEKIRNGRIHDDRGRLYRVEISRT